MVGCWVLGVGCWVRFFELRYHEVFIYLFLGTDAVKSIPPNTENSMQHGHDENDNNMSNETKRETNYSINNNTRYMQLTKYNKYTNDDVLTDACVVHMIH